jgi:energy-coupling factor transporter ATP-binding protein EcfA2
MRKLTVKNFSVIKEAELEFGKITVLIGPQSSGKSLLSKLAYFLGREVINIAIERVVNRFEYGFSDFEVAVKKEFSKWFPRGGWGNEDWSVVFSSRDFEVTISAPSTSEPDAEAGVTFNEPFKLAYLARINATIEHQQKGGFLIAQAFESLARTDFMELSGRAVFDVSTYIPLERSYFVDTFKGYRYLGTEPDPISARFGLFYANSLKPASEMQRISRYLKGDLVSWQNDWMFDFHDGRFLPLSHLSSGSKQTLPILAALEYYESQRRQSGHLLTEELYGHKLYSSDDLTIEEPEASVFPQTQYELVREFAALANEVDFQPHFTITTHSPYILTAFNNLIEAGQVARAKPELKDEIAKLIPEKFWIKEGDFKAYAIEGGVLKSIVAEDTGLVSANYLDQVSETIGMEFDELLRLGYVES